jgi:hypothetical protein
MAIKIERYEVITVKEATINDWGDLVVIDTTGKEYKIGAKRSNLFDTFQPGAEVKIGYAVYMNKEYIATAEQTGTHTEPQSPLVAEAVKMGAKVTNVTNTKDRAVALSYAKDAWIAGKIDKEKIYNCADFFLKYIEDR